jgi:hypothetical protein
MRGSREFHTHPGHLNEAWENYRKQAGMTLLGYPSTALWLLAAVAIPAGIFTSIHHAEFLSSISP